MLCTPASLRRSRTPPAPIPTTEAIALGSPYRRRAHGTHFAGEGPSQIWPSRSSEIMGQVYPYARALTISGTLVPRRATAHEYAIHPWAWTTSGCRREINRRSPQVIHGSGNGG